MIIAVTGHRPDKIEVPIESLYWMIRGILDSQDISSLIVGMAAGVDLVAGTAGIDAGIPVVAVVPWKGHKPRIADRSNYEAILDGSNEIFYVSPAETYPGPWIYQKRNEWMVDRASHILAYWNGDPRGGTANCIEYARSVNKPIKNIYL